MSQSLLQLLSNRNASAFSSNIIDPSSGNKAATGFINGSIWVNTLTNHLFICIDDVVGLWLVINETVQNNFGALVDPTATDDTTAGFSAGSIWVNTVTNVAYIAVGVIATAAIWKIISGPKDNFTAITVPGISNDNTQGYSNGSRWVDTLTGVVYTAVSVTTGAANWIASGPKNNFTAITVPGISNDNTQGYSNGSRWVDTLTGVVYTAVSVTTGAANWTASGLATVATTFPTSPSPGSLFHDTANDLTYLWDGFSWIDIAAAGSSGLVKNNYSATIAPINTDDATNGYVVGSTWVDVTSRSVYINMTNTAGLAVWFKVQSDSQWEVVAVSPHAAFSGESLFIDTALIPISVSLPLSPILGDRIQFADSKGTFATNNLTIIRNGNTIMGLATDMVIATNFTTFNLTYNGTDWRITT